MQIDEFVDWIEKHRRIFGLSLLLPSFYFSYLIYVNFEGIQDWLFSLAGVEPENVRPAYKLSWIGLLSLIALSVSVGILINKKPHKIE